MFQKIEIGNALAEFDDLKVCNRALVLRFFYITSKIKRLIGLVKDYQLTGGKSKYSYLYKSI